MVTITITAYQPAGTATLACTNPANNQLAYCPNQFTVPTAIITELPPGAVLATTPGQSLFVTPNVPPLLPLSSSGPVSNPSPTDPKVTGSTSQVSVPGSTPFIPTSSAPGASPSLGRPSASASNKSKGGISAGGAAGIAIGCLLAGAIIASLILCLLYRRRKNQPVYPQQHLPYNGTQNVEKGGIVSTGPVGGGVVSNLDHLLPPPAEDAAITKELSKLRDNIKNHVRTYYHSDPVPSSSIKETALFELASVTGLSSSALLVRFLEPSTRHSAIRLFIAWVTTSRCSGDRFPSFLPDEISRLIADMSSKNGKDASKSSGSGEPSRSADIGPGQAALVSKWKTITGALLQQKFGQAVNEGDSRAERITEAINQLNTFLAPFIAPGIDTAHRQRNLEMIMGRSAYLAFLLFSQPGSFQFDLGQPRTVGDTIVVFPALLQTVDDSGRRLPSPRLLWDKEEVN